MQNKPRSRTVKPDPNIIAASPDAEPLDLDEAQSAAASEIIGDLSSLAERALAYGDYNSPAATRARMMEPYAKKVFWFVCVYTGVVIFVVILSGFGVCSFSLPTPILLALVGSTAVAAFGLVKGVVGGLFAHP